MAHYSKGKGPCERVGIMSIPFLGSVIAFEARKCLYTSEIKYGHVFVKHNLP
jgi:hypothetical protein